MVMKAETDLLEIVHTLRPSGRLARRLNGRQQQGQVAGKRIRVGERRKNVVEQQDPFAVTLQGVVVRAELNALDADRDLFQSQLALSQIQLNEVLSVVQLYKALGGGWQ